MKYIWILFLFGALSQAAGLGHTMGAGEKSRHYGSPAISEKPGHTMRFPSIWFYYNSSQIDSISYSQELLLEGKDMLTFMVDVMKENPKIVVELSAHCSTNEKYQDELSLLRAETIRLELMKRGSDGSRLIAKGYSAHRLLVSLDMIRKAKTKEEREALHRQNRRCVFKILSWE